MSLLNSNKSFTIIVVMHMYCKKCGAALPSHGFVCKRCGTMMDEEQIKEQKRFRQDKDTEKMEVHLKSDRYSSEPINRDYKKHKDNKYLGAIFIVLVVLILIIIAILKVM